jgi:DNA polymerase IIIc chi subunit
MLMVNVLKDGYNNPAAACEHATNQYNFYKGQGWTKVTLKVTNKCAANDGFIQFLAYG